MSTTNVSNTTNSPSLTLPASEQVSAGATLDTTGISYSDSVAAANAGAMYLQVTATDGTLSATDLAGAAVSGSGTDALTLSGSYADVNQALASLEFTAAASGGSGSISFDLWNQDGVETTGVLPVSISGGTGGTSSSGGTGSTGGTSGGSGSTSTSDGSGPVFTEPSSETVAPGGTVAVTGSYFDTYGPNHPGSMYVEAIVKNGGTVQATDTAGNPVAGSGTSAIRLNTDYATINAVLHSLTYTAGPTAGTDSIYMEVWNQLGTVRIDTVPVTITAAGGGGSGGTGGGGTGGSTTPTLTEAGTATIAAGTSQALAGSYADSFAAGNAGAMYLSISAGTGTLSATDASGHSVTGSGTHAISLSTDYADVNAILQSLSYTAGTSAASDSIHFDLYNQAGVETTGTTTLTISGASGGGTGGGTGGSSGGTNPALTAPASVTASASGSVAVGGSYADSFAQGNAGTMYLSITDSSGTLSATDAAGNAIAGSGSATLTAQMDFVDVNAILASLHYTAPGTAGSDTIHFDLWNQAGVETTGATAVTIDSPAVSSAMQQASASMLADLAPVPQSSNAVVLPADATGTQSSAAAFSSIGTQPAGIPIVLQH